MSGGCDVGTFCSDTDWPCFTGIGSTSTRRNTQHVSTRHKHTHIFYSYMYGRSFFCLLREATAGPTLWCVKYYIRVRSIFDLRVLQGRILIIEILINFFQAAKQRNPKTFQRKIIIDEATHHYRRRARVGCSNPAAVRKASVTSRRWTISLSPLQAPPHETTVTSQRRCHDCCGMVHP